MAVVWPNIAFSRSFAYIGFADRKRANVRHSQSIDVDVAKSGMRRGRRAWHIFIDFTKITSMALPSGSCGVDY